MPLGTIIVLSLILIILLIGIGFYIHLKRAVEGYSLQLFGTKDFISAIKAQREELASTPKTPYGMDSLIMPDLAKDFPYMNVDEMKKLAEENLLTYLNCLEQKQILHFNNPSEKLKMNIKKEIDDLKKSSVKFEDITVHKTVINKYNKTASVCTLVFQTALGFKFVKDGQSKKVEERMNTEFTYVYNDKKIKTGESISLHCPNCGAPIEGLGHKICPYCQAGLIDLAPKTWKLNDIKIIK